MLQNAYFLAKIGAVTAENEHHFAGFGSGGDRGRSASAEGRAGVVHGRRRPHEPGGKAAEADT